MQLVLSFSLWGSACLLVGTSFGALYGFSYRSILYFGFGQPAQSRKGVALNESKSQRKRRLAKEHNERYVFKQQYRIAVELSKYLPERETVIIERSIATNRRAIINQSAALALTAGVYAIRANTKE